MNRPRSFLEQFKFEDTVCFVLLLRESSPCLHSILEKIEYDDEQEHEHAVQPTLKRSDFSG